MEAKVDVRKLQILNDRINQTIDALSQVRFSVHGLGHTGVPTKMMNPFGTIPQPFGTVPQTFGYPNYPSFLGVPPIPPTPVLPHLFGLSHTPFVPPVNPFFQTPFTSPVVNPMINPPIPTPGFTPTWGVPPTPWLGSGLFHSTPEPIEKLLELKMLGIDHPLRALELYRNIDPYRIAQTFPFLNY